MQKIERQLPAYPLFVKDPYFSVWSGGEVLNAADPVFWTGDKSIPMYGLIYVNGRCYCFMGDAPAARKLKQTALRVTAFGTEYDFSGDNFTLTVRFLSPLLPDDLDTLSNPCCYFDYRITTDNDVETMIMLVISESICYQHKAPVRGGVLKFSEYEAGWFGLKRQMPLSHAQDATAADWGYYYAAGESAYIMNTADLWQLIRTGKFNGQFSENGTTYLTVCNCGRGNSSGHMVIAFDDTVSICYFGQWLKGYYFRNGKTIFDAIAEAYSGYAKTVQKLESFDTKLRNDAMVYGEEYYRVLTASLRQSIAAHKLVQTADGRLLFLSDECNSNGCIATVDVSYSSMPLYLLYNPALVRGMLEPIFEFAEKDVWEFDYAPHDVGTYPYVCGQVYRMQQKANKYHANYRRGDSCETHHLLLYAFPKGSELYRLHDQMPLEESGNMLIMCAAYLKYSGDTVYIKNKLNLLKKWSGYLAENGLYPENQLCTDDFSGYLDKNVNLSIKAAVGLGAMAQICESLGEYETATEYSKTAREFASVICKAGADRMLPLSYDNKLSEYSLKYNLAFDKILGLGLFPRELLQRETKGYLKYMTPYGIPMDERDGIAKTDWQFWAASLSDDMATRRAMVAAVDRYLRESPSRVPFPDCYDVSTGLAYKFRNRTVQGGNFILLLADRKETEGKK